MPGELHLGILWTPFLRSPGICPGRWGPSLVMHGAPHLGSNPRRGDPQTLQTLRRARGGGGKGGGVVVGECLVHIIFLPRLLLVWLQICDEMRFSVI